MFKRRRSGLTSITLIPNRREPFVNKMQILAKAFIFGVIDLFMQKLFEAPHVNMPLSCQDSQGYDLSDRHVGCATNSPSSVSGYTLVEFQECHMPSKI